MAGAIAGAAGTQAGMQGLQMVADMLGQFYSAAQSKKAARQSWKRTRWLFSNQHQIMMQDLEKAGLNPILAAGGGGLHQGMVPSSPVADVPANVLSGVASGAQDFVGKVQAAKAMTKQLRQMDQSLINMRADVDTTVSQKLKNMAEMRLFEKLWEKADADKAVSMHSARSIELENMYKAMGMPKAKADMEFFETNEWARKMTLWMNILTGRDQSGARQ